MGLLKGWWVWQKHGVGVEVPVGKVGGVKIPTQQRGAETATTSQASPFLPSSLIRTLNISWAPCCLATE